MGNRGEYGSSRNGRRVPLEIIKPEKSADGKGLCGLEVFQIVPITDWLRLIAIGFFQLHIFLNKKGKNPGNEFLFGL